MRYELTDGEWAAIKPMLPDKPRVTVEPVQDDVWSVGKPLSIMSASIRFDSSPTNRNVRKSEP
jgi:transposase